MLLSWIVRCITLSAGLIRLKFAVRFSFDGLICLVYREECLMGLIVYVGRYCMVGAIVKFLFSFGIGLCSV